ncbi:MAG: hypothetical protein ABSD69_02100 [Candidatus Levyibacteriota bacterium]|jgi:hypothetical protein
MRQRLSKAKIKEIQYLRARGYTIPEICSKLKIAKTTVFYHAGKITILPDFMDSWRIKRGGSKRIKSLKEERALKEAEILLKDISKKEKTLFISALYWAEGNKKDFMLTNTDPNLIKVFVSGLREIFNIQNERLRMSIRIYEDMDAGKCLDFWSNVVNLPKEQFQHISVLKGKKKGKLEFGMCRVRVSRGGDLLKRLKAVNKVFSDLVESKADLK